MGNRFTVNDLRATEKSAVSAPPGCKQVVLHHNHVRDILDEIARLQQENSDLKDAIKAIKAGKLDETLIEEKDREIYDLQRRVEELEGAIRAAIRGLDSNTPCDIQIARDVLKAMESK